MIAQTHAANAIAMAVRYLPPHPPGPGSDENIRVLSYRRDFDLLWTIPGELTDWLRDHRRLVLVWDETPHDSLLDAYNLGNYLTAVDFAIALSLAMRSIAPNRRWRLSIIDHASHNHKDAGSVRLFRELREGRTLLPNVELYGAAEADQLIAALLDCSTIAMPRSTDFQIVRNLWLQLLEERPERRHAIANVVGPQLLLEILGAPPSPASRPVLRALRTLTRWLMTPIGHFAGAGHEAAPAPRSTAPWCGPDIWRGIIDGFIVLDDLEGLGWSSFLRAALAVDDREGPGRGRLLSFRSIAERSSRSASAIDLLGHLERRLELMEAVAEGASEPGRYCRAFEIVPNISRTILFLDLRLYSEADQDAERALCQRLLELFVPRFRALEARRSLPWPIRLSNDALAPIERYAAGRSTHPDDHAAALTLLPTLLATADPTLPIVLFSTTGRRSICDRLQTCRNIITYFDKPRFPIESIDALAIDAEARFRHAIDAALRLARGRKICVDLLELDRRGLRTQRAIAARPLKTDGSIFEIYVDESGCADVPPFSVGAFALLLSSDEHAARLDHELHARRLIWGLAEGRPPKNINDELEQRFVKKEPDEAEYRRRLDELDSLLKHLEIDLFAFALINRRPLSRELADRPLILRENELDNRHLTMLRDLMEAIVFDFACRLPDPPARIRIDAPTRWFPIHSENVDGEQMLERFGVRYEQSRKLAQGIGHSDVRRMIADVFDRRPQLLHGWDADRVRGVQLLDFETLRLHRRNHFWQRDKGKRSKTQYERELEQKPRPRQIHYLADWVARLCRRPFGRRPTPMPNIMGAWFAGGFLQNYDVSFTKWLEASRCADKEDFVLAIINAAHALYGAGPRSSPDGLDYGRFIFARCAEWVLNLNGEAFLRLCDFLAADRLLAQMSALKRPGASR